MEYFIHHCGWATIVTKFVKFTHISYVFSALLNLRTVLAAKFSLQNETVIETLKDYREQLTLKFNYAIRSLESMFLLSSRVRYSIVILRIGNGVRYTDIE